MGGGQSREQDPGADLGSGLEGGLGQTVNEAGCPDLGAEYRAGTMALAAAQEDPRDPNGPNYDGTCIATAQVHSMGQE